MCWDNFAGLTIFALPTFHRMRDEGFNRGNIAVEFGTDLYGITGHDEGNPQKDSLSGGTCGHHI
jgi:hypothetical protein